MTNRSWSLAFLRFVFQGRVVFFITLTCLLSGPLFCQSQAPAPDQSEIICQFDVKQLEPADPSPEFIRLQSEFFNAKVPATQQMILRLADEIVPYHMIYQMSYIQTTESRRLKRAEEEERQRVAGAYLDALITLLPQKKGKAQVDSFFTLIENQHLRGLPMPSGTQHCLQRVVARIYPTLSFEDQWSVIFSCDYCHLFESPALTSYWQQLYESLKDHLKEVPSDDLELNRTLHAYRTRILRRIYEADASLGRRMILQEIAAPQPRCDIAALAILPDKTLPSMDALFAEQLDEIYEKSDWCEYEAKLAVIERYATEGILEEMKQRYSSDPDQRNHYHRPLFLSYFLRTDPAFGKAAVEACLKLQASCGVLLTQLAEVRPQPALLEVARMHLNDANKAVAADASYVFKYVADGGVEPVLWQDLEDWNRLWAFRPNSIPYEEQNYQDSLVEALMFGGSPCKRRETLERLKPLYIKGRSVDGNIDFPDWHDPIHISLRDLTDKDPRYTVDFCFGSVTFDELKSALPRFPNGTVFEWHRSFYLLLDAAIEPNRLEIKRLAEQLGMTLKVIDVD